MVSNARTSIARGDESAGPRTHMRYLALVSTAAALIFCAPDAFAKSSAPSYDGAWSLLFVTQRGACDSTYNFNVRIFNGMVTHQTW
jgi:hypothetical protein